MNKVYFRCPVPLVIKMVKRARELGGKEHPYHNGAQCMGPDRYTLAFAFEDTSASETYFNEAIKAIGQWEDENEPDDEC